MSLCVQQPVPTFRPQVVTSKSESKKTERTSQSQQPVPTFRPQVVTSKSESEKNDRTSQSQQPVPTSRPQGVMLKSESEKTDRTSQSQQPVPTSRPQGVTLKSDSEKNERTLLSQQPVPTFRPQGVTLKSDSEKNDSTPQSQQPVPNFRQQVVTSKSESEKNERTLLSQQPVPTFRPQGVTLKSDSEKNDSTPQSQQPVPIFRQQVVTSKSQSEKNERTPQSQQSSNNRSENKGSSSRSEQSSNTSSNDKKTSSSTGSLSNKGDQDSDSDERDESRKRFKPNEITSIRNFLLLGTICGIIATMIKIYSPEQIIGITLPDDIPEQAPVFFYAETESSPFRLFKPNGRVTNLPINSRLLLVSSGRDSNYIKKANLQNLLLIYHGNNVFKTIENVEYNLNQLTTSSPATATLRRIPYGHGYIIEIGFEYGTNQFAVLYTIYCNGDGTRTYYTHNTINGATIKHDVKKKRRPAFSADGMDHNTVAVSNIYRHEHQIARFEFLFGPSQPYVKSKQFLARGHLTPDADMIFPYEKLATYYYGNVAPQFQPINAGNWLRVEKLARSLAEQLNRDLQVYTGYMGILRLPHPLSPTNEVEIYLDENIRIYVPEFFFKVLLDEESDSAIVFVTSNNPFATQVNEFATNIANEAGFGNDNFLDYTRGYTFCLSLPDFLNHFPYLPKNVNATNILRWNPSDKK